MTYTCSLISAALVLATAAPMQAQADPISKDTASVKAVLARYNAAVEKLDATGTDTLFAPESQIFETGSAEGTYANYLAHHLGPELAEFRSFKFSDYKVAVQVVGDIAWASETYRYTIVPVSGEVAERLGVATSVLRRIAGKWRIVSMHNSGRRPKV